MRQFINIVEAAQKVSIDSMRQKQWELLSAHDEAKKAFEADRNPETLRAYQEAENAVHDFKREMLTYYSTQHMERPETPIPDYAGEHSAPTAHSGAPLWNVSLNGIYPEDFYTRSMSQYVNDPEEEYPMLDVVQKAHNRPNLSLKIYRAIPKGLPRKINPGDWVAPLRRYATLHGRSSLNDEYVIVSKSVFARDIFTEGNSLAEWGYDPQPSFPYFPAGMNRRKAPTSLD